jgi:hypothetical protein
MLRYYIVLLLTISIISCSETSQKENSENDSVISNPEYGIWQDREAKPFEFGLIDSIKVESPDNFIFGEISAITTDNEGNIYLYDDQQYKLLSFSKDGSFRWIVGQKGRGPSDFENVNDLVTNDKWLVVGNQNGTRIDLFDFNGNYLKSNTIPKDVEFRYFRYANYQGFSNNDNLVINTINWDGWGHNIYTLDISLDSSDVVNSFLIDQSGEIEIPEMMNVSTPITLHNDKIIGGSLQDYSLEVYNLNGSLEKTILRNFDKIIRPGMYNSQGIKSMDFYSMVKSPIILPQGFWIVPTYWATNVTDPDQRLKQDLDDANIPEVTFRNSLDFYNSEGILLYSMESNGEHPKIGEIKHFDNNGNIYVIENYPEPMIYSYRVLTPNIKK